MSDRTRWALKVHAYLHPLRAALGGPPGDPPDWEDLAGRAGALAAGTRTIGPFAGPQPAPEELRHPLSGQPIDLAALNAPLPWSRAGARLALEAEVGAIRGFTPTDDRLQFLGIWSALFERLRARRGAGELGALWMWLPADGPAPGYPAVAHLPLVSAIASVLAEDDEPALLSFTLGPVQSFIAQARRSSDLCAGSALLSHTLVHALGPVVSELGPDHVVFPCLRRSALFRQWQSENAFLPTGIGGEPVAASPLAALPNRFLAIVPAKRMPAIAEACEQAARDWLNGQIEQRCTVIEDLGRGMQGFARMGAEQARAFLQVAWASSPWPAADRVTAGDEACRTVAWVRGGRLPDSLAGHLEAAAGAEAAGLLSHATAGVLYGPAYDGAQVLLDAVKRARPIPEREEGGLKCSLCGERSVVPAELPFHEQKAIWGNLREKLGPRGWLRRGEALCGVCWTKRHFGLKELEAKAPSTSDVAAAPFRRALRSALDRDPALAAPVEALAGAVAASGAGNSLRGASSGRAGGGNPPTAADQLMVIPGEAFLPFPREELDDSQDDEAGSAARQAVASSAIAVRRAASDRGLSLPRPYLAVLALDGDRMGAWLSGDRAAKLGDMLPASVRKSFIDQGGEPLLRHAWPVTPAMHAAFSEACGVFSQRTAVRTLEEEDLPAFLVYAGGDDVLGLTPVGCATVDGGAVELATEAAWRLRLRFSGCVRVAPPRDRPDPAGSLGFVVDPQAGAEPAFGSSATASVGIAVFHHRWPLGRALAEARAALEFAKEHMGRDALALTILRRSGQVTKAGLKFFASGSGPAAPPIKAFQQLAAAFASGTLSPKFVAEAHARLSVFKGGLGLGELQALGLPLAMEAAEGHAASGIQDVRQALEVLYSAAGGATGPAASAGPADLLQLNRWLGLLNAAAFMGRGGDV